MITSHPADDPSFVPPQSAADVVRLLTTNPEYAAGFDRYFASVCAPAPPQPKPQRVPLPCLKAGWSRECREVMRSARDTYLDNASYVWPNGFDRAFIISGLETLAINRPDLSTDALVEVLREALRFAGLE